MESATELLSEDRILAVEIRKLRKKLRQIENLEIINRPLTFEEKEKIDKKFSLRFELLDKIEQHVNLATSRVIPSAPPLKKFSSNNKQDSNVNSDRKDKENNPVEDIEAEEENQVDDNEDNEIVEEIHVEMKRKFEDDPYLQKEGDLVQDGGDKTQCNDRTESERNENVLDEVKEGESSTVGKESQASPEKSALKSKKKSPKRTKEGSPSAEQGWASVKFLVRELEGHNDLVCAVACQVSTIVSGGRDTMVKVWDADTGLEIRSLGGHTGTVTSLIIIPPQVCERLVPVHDLTPDRGKVAISGSTDCSIRLWCLNTGEMLRSIYTYNSVECLGIIQDRGYIVSGSDGGKVEMWDITTGDNIFTTIGHEEGVTCIKVEGNNVITTSADGIIKVWELRDKTLHTMYKSENVTSQSSSKPLARREIKSLAYRNYIYYGDDGLNVKALDWKKSVVHKLKHHLGDFGSTGAMCSTGDVLACAGYDLDNGQAYVNFWSLPEEVYLATLNDQDTNQIITIDCTTTEMGYLRIVTGGQEVKVWDRIPKKRYSPQDTIPIEFNCQYTTRAQDSDIDSDTSESENDAETETRHHGRRRWSENSSASDKEQTGWIGQWCTVV